MIGCLLAESLEKKEAGILEMKAKAQEAEAKAAEEAAKAATGNRRVHLFYPFHFNKGS